MQALISPNEFFDIRWVSSWEASEEGWVPVYSTLVNCWRVAEISEQIFEVAPPLFWLDCPENCVANDWYYKDGYVYQKPTDAPQPE
jgi:hypothetical protein